MKRINLYTFEESSLLSHNAISHFFLKTGVVKNGSHNFQAWTSLTCTNTESRKSGRCLKPGNGKASVCAEMQNLNISTLISWSTRFCKLHCIASIYCTEINHYPSNTDISLEQDNREFRNRRKNKRIWCLSFADLFQLRYADCKYCFICFTSKTAFLINSAELK